MSGGLNVLGHVRKGSARSSGRGIRSFEASRCRSDRAITISSVPAGNRVRPSEERHEPVQQRCHPAPLAPGTAPLTARAATAGHDVELDIGEPLTEAVDEISGERVKPRGARRDLEEPSFPSIEDRERLLDPARAREEGPGLLDEVLARGRELDPAPVSDEQLGSHRALERLDLLGEARLGDPKMLRRAPEVAFFGDREEVSELSKFHLLFLLEGIPALPRPV